MKRLLIILPLTMIILMLIPLFALIPTDLKTVETPTEIDSGEKVKVYICERDRTVKMSEEEYLIGVIASEISPEYEEEAIKAQAVAARSMLYFRRSGNSNQDYDITDDISHDQGYCDSDSRKVKWGDKTAEYEAKIKQCITATHGELVRYNGEVALAVYHSVSSGKTENVSDVWGGDYPYLKSVDSVGDMLSSEYMSTVTVTKEEYTAAAQSSGATDISSPSADSNAKCAATGLVLSYNLCGVTVTGQQMRELFSLKSANFTISQSEDTFTFTVRGNGHGVGMSQNGANYMATQGSTYKEILKWYYSGCEIE